MPRLEESRFGFLFRQEAFLIGFVLMAVLNAALAWLQPSENNPPHVWLISIFVYSVLGWFTHQKQKLATWALCLLMLFSGLLHLVAGTEGDLGMKLVNLFVGGYFTYGGILIFLNRPGRDV
ncbi:hypothetical protein [Salidesulfovibrio onnuriiensis]|uniref:hypothetical protein n=1 Tax=Salidesulfovibrio onnuriiensis TaxID=2583823 RepID=UPI0011CBBFA9|nr:hypothetical protein [Salidesulfovibrio onnuriiensis]